MTVLITGHSRGLGAALAAVYLARGERVFGLSRTRSRTPHPHLVEAQADLARPHELPAVLDAAVAPALDLVILNAGVLGPIAALADTPLDTVRQVMDVNVWSNKIVLDWLVAHAAAPAQVVLMSSGAAVSGNYGWGAYALSKATLNMLAQLYAHELPRSHLCALAPGLVATAMQDTLATLSAAEFPSLARLQAARGTAAMPEPARAAAHIADIVPELVRFPSGAFVDLRREFPFNAAGSGLPPARQ